MPPARRKPNDTEEAATDLMMLVGQLLEATRTAADGLQSVNAEVKTQAAALAAATMTLEILEEKVRKIERLVLDNTHDGNLVMIAHEHAAQLEDLRREIAAVQASANSLTSQLTGVAHERAQTAGFQKSLWYVLAGLAWLVTTGIALYAALTGK